VTSAGFLGRPALATPAIPLDHLTAGFSVAAPGGRLLAAGSALDTAAPHPLGFLVLVGVARSGVAAVRSAQLSRRRRRPLLLAVLVGFVVLAEAMMCGTPVAALDRGAVSEVVAELMPSLTSAPTSSPRRAMATAALTAPPPMSVVTSRASVLRPPPGGGRNCRH